MINIQKPVGGSKPVQRGKRNVATVIEIFDLLLADSFNKIPLSRIASTYECLNERHSSQAPDT